MKDNKGRFLKGHLITEEELIKKKKSLVKSWKERENYHGLYYSKIYNTWRSMKGRCNGNNKSGKEKYKDKGITYCSEWESFKVFYEDMKDSHFEGSQLDRIDNLKGYYKENCRWATPKENSNNRSNTVIITYNGESLPLSFWADKLGIKFSTIRNRYYRNYLKNKCTLDEVFKK